MNKIFSIIASVAFVFASFSASHAQKTMKQGMISMELTEVSAEDPAMNAQLGMMKGSTTNLYFNQDKTMTKMDMMGGMMEMTIVADSDTKAGFMLFNMDMLGQKVKVDITEEDAAQRQKESEATEFEVTYDKSDTKEIAGYKTYKAMISGPQLQGATITAYVTQDIKIDADVIQGVDASKIDGFPLEYTMNAQGIKMVYTTVEIKDDIDASVFDVNTDGYETQTMEEFTKTMGAMGGMGF